MSSTHRQWAWQFFLKLWHTGQQYGRWFKFMVLGQPAKEAFYSGQIACQASASQATSAFMGHPSAHVAGVNSG
jgi:hypothetical protein